MSRLAKGATAVEEVFLVVVDCTSSEVEHAIQSKLCSH